MEWLDNLDADSVQKFNLKIDFFSVLLIAGQWTIPDFSAWMISRVGESAL